MCDTGTTLKAVTKKALSSTNQNIHFPRNSPSADGTHENVLRQGGWELGTILLVLAGYLRKANNFFPPDVPLYVLLRSRQALQFPKMHASTISPLDSPKHWICCLVNFVMPLCFEIYLW